MSTIAPNDFSEEQRKATFDLTSALIEMAEKTATDQKSLGVALNALLSAYGNLITRNGLEDYGAKAARILAKVLEQKDASLLSARAAGRA